jgi:hypothetical protein
MSDNPYLHRGDEWWVKPDIETVPDCKDIEIKRLRARIEVLERVREAALPHLFEPSMESGMALLKAVQEAKP